MLSSEVPRCRWDSLAGVEELTKDPAWDKLPRITNDQLLDGLFSHRATDIGSNEGSFRHFKTLWKHLDIGKVYHVRIEEHEELDDYSRLMYRHCTWRFVDSNDVCEWAWCFYTLYTLYNIQPKDRYDRRVVIPMPMVMWEKLDLCMETFGDVGGRMRGNEDPYQILKRMFEGKVFSWSLAHRAMLVKPTARVTEVDPHFAPMANNDAAASGVKATTNGVVQGRVVPSAFVKDESKLTTPRVDLTAAPVGTSSISAVTSKAPKCLTVATTKDIDDKPPSTNTQQAAISGDSPRASDDTGDASGAVPVTKKSLVPAATTPPNTAVGISTSSRRNRCFHPMLKQMGIVRVVSSVPFGADESKTKSDGVDDVGMSGDASMDATASSARTTRKGAKRKSDKFSNEPPKESSIQLNLAPENVLDHLDLAKLRRVHQSYERSLKRTSAWFTQCNKDDGDEPVWKQMSSAINTALAADEASETKRRNAEAARAKKKRRRSANAA